MPRKPDAKADAVVAASAAPSAEEALRTAHNRDLCSICGMGGDLLCCDACPRVFHLQCAHLRVVPQGLWKCSACAIENKSNKHGTVRPKIELEAPSLNGQCAQATLGRLMQHLELTVPLATFTRAALVLSALNATAKRAAAGPDLSMMVTLTRIAQVVGNDALLNAMRAVEAGAHLAYGLGTMGGPGQFCPSCSEFTVCRSICLHCGTFTVDARGTDMYIGVAFDDMASKLLEKPTPAAIAAAALRGVQYFAQCLEEPKCVAGYAGDMLFLAQKLIGVVRGHAELEPLAVQVFEAMAVRFCAGHLHLDSDRMEDPHYMQDTVEGMHALRKRSHFPAVNSAGRALLLDDDAAAAAVAINGVAAAVAVTADAVQTPLSSETSAHVTRAATRSTKMARPSNETFDYEALAGEVKRSMRQFDLSEVLGFDPNSCTLPMTPLRSCSHCGDDNKAGETRCGGCGCQLRCRVDYGALTDAIVWSYVFSNVGFPLECQTSNRAVELNFCDVLPLLPDARSYKELDELGSDLWKLQAYFATHFVYIMSDWGSRPLRREIYQEEFRFFAEGLHRVTSMHDAELIGEFLHCLRVLGVDPSKPESEDAQLMLVYWEGVSMLVKMESAGQWTASTSVPYARYHAAWCGVVGLVGFDAFADVEPAGFVGAGLGAPTKPALS